MTIILSVEFLIEPTKITYLSESGEVLDRCEITKEIYEFIEMKIKEFGSATVFFDRLMTDTQWAYVHHKKQELRKDLKLFNQEYKKKNASVPELEKHLAKAKEKYELVDMWLQLFEKKQDKGSALDHLLVLIWMFMMIEIGIYKSRGRM